jgi:hypothetical protein
MNQSSSQILPNLRFFQLRKFESEIFFLPPSTFLLQLPIPKFCVRQVSEFLFPNSTWASHTHTHTTNEVFRPFH